MALAQRFRGVSVLQVVSDFLEDYGCAGRLLIMAGGGETNCFPVFRAQFQFAIALTPMVRPPMEPTSTTMPCSKAIATIWRRSDRSNWRA